MRRILLFVFLGALALAAHAQPWTLGPSDLIPTTHPPAAIATASSRDQHLVVWLEQRGSGEPPSRLYAARVSSSGEVLDPAGLYIGEAGDSASVQAASDGENFLVVWRLAGLASLQSTRISPNGEVAASNLVTGHYVEQPIALAFNGRTYALGTDYSVSLLDRDGLTMSGMLHGQVRSLAARDGRWIAFRGSGWTELGEADFPPLRQVREFPSGHRLDVGARDLVGAAVTADGFVTASTFSRDSASIVVRWLDRDGLEIAGRDARVRIPVPKGVSDLRVAVDGDDVYVAYARAGIWTLLHIDGEGAREVMTARDVLLSASALFWIDRGDAQLYTTRLIRGALAASPRLVSQHLPEQYDSVLVSAANVHLAVWKEETRDGARTYYALLTAEGRPFTAARVLTEWNGKFAVASDGTSFLLVWEKGTRFFGSCVLASDGTITSGPFDIEHARGEAPGSIAWDGRSSYVLAINDRSEVLRFSQQGAVVDRVALPFYTIGTPLLRQVDDGFIAILVYTWYGRCTCPYGNDAQVLILDRDLRRDERRDDPWREQHWVWYSSYDVHAFVTGGGHRLFVRGAFPYDGLAAIGDDGEEQTLSYAPAISYWMTAGWTGTEFLVAAREVLAHHAPDGTLLRVSALPAGTLRSAIASDPQHVPVLLTERLSGATSRLQVLRLDDH